LNVQRTIKQFIAAGAKGCTLEDQKWPKKSGSVRGKEVIGMDEHIAKVHAVCISCRLCFCRYIPAHVCGRNCHFTLTNCCSVLLSLGVIVCLQVAAAREAIGDADFFLIARTDARATSSKRGLDEAINRANIYLVSSKRKLHYFSVCVCTVETLFLHGLGLLQPVCMATYCDGVQLGASTSCRNCSIRTVLVVPLETQ